MSKKKNKFKKKKSHKPSYTVFGNIAPAVAMTEQAVSTESVASTAETVAPAEIAKSEQLVPICEADADDPRYKAMRKDIQKILITFACLGIILVGAYFINSKTTVFDSFGDWIYKIANIQVL